MTTYKKGSVLEAKNLRRPGSGTHAVIIEVSATEYRLRSVRITDGKPEFFPGAQSRSIPIKSIPVRYRPTKMTMKVE
jgi:hypothetical protein